MNASPLLTRREAVSATAQTAGAMVFSGIAMGAEESTTRTLPNVPGRLAVPWRRREKQGDRFRLIEETVEWNASETAIIICDMWADHPCRLAAMRVSRMAPKMNEVVSLARDHGVAIIHAPSSGVKYYEETPHRARMKAARSKKPPVPIQGWCYHNSDREGPWPIVDDIRRGKAKVTGCDDPIARPHMLTDRHQHPAISITGYDGVSHDGQEIYNFLEQENRQNIVLMGVHTNMCVLGRPFGIRQQKYLGKNVVLCRDLTDALYDPRDKPYVSHARGVELVVEHIEKYWCPSIVADSLTRVRTGTAGPIQKLPSGISGQTR
ncbi:MAG: isochorismatase family protein [Planctomycetaceae bacterium]